MRELRGRHSAKSTVLLPTQLNCLVSRALVIDDGDRYSAGFTPVGVAAFKVQLSILMQRDAAYEEPHATVSANLEPINAGAWKFDIAPDHRCEKFLYLWLRTGCPHRSGNQR